MEVNGLRRLMTHQNELLQFSHPRTVARRIASGCACDVAWAFESGQVLRSSVSSFSPLRAVGILSSTSELPLLCEREILSENPLLRTLAIWSSDIQPFN